MQLMEIMMETKELLIAFFSKSLEAEINEKMLYYAYSFEYEKVNEYIKGLIDIPLEDFISFVLENYKVPYLEASDVLQYSSFDDCTVNICKVFKEAGDKGFTALEAGKLLENDGIERKDGAYLKYGENHSKAAVQLGLLNCLSNKFFLSCLGYVINDIDITEQRKIITRLILRNKLVQRLLYKAIKNGHSDYNYETGFLSSSTSLRRKSNVRKVIEYLCSTDEIDLSGLLSEIVF